MNKIISLILSSLYLPLLISSLIADPVKVGVSTALTGEAAPFGMDIKNALTLVNNRIGKGRYQFIFEDEKCENRAAVSVAQKLINIDKIQYALGFPCNQTLLATANLYQRAKVLVVTSSATSGAYQL